MHRLVQDAVIARLSPAERTVTLDAAIVLLGQGFENTWNKVTNHQFSAWEKCEVRVPHIKALISKSQKLGCRATDAKAFAELVFRFAW